MRDYKMLFISVYLILINKLNRPTSLCSVASPLGLYRLPMPNIKDACAGLI